VISLALVAGLIVVGAAAVAVTLTDGRVVAAALFVALAVSPFATDPLPGALEIAARLVAAMLAGYVLWIVMKGGGVRSSGTAIGIAAELGVAATAYALGWWLTPVHPLQGPVAEQATGFALVGLAVIPLAGSNVLRAGIGIVLIVLGAGLVMQAWLGPAPALVQLALTVLLLGVPAGLSLVVDADDAIAKVVPAVERPRPEPAAAMEPIFTRRPKLEVEEPQPIADGPESSSGAGPASESDAAPEAEPGAVDAERQGNATRGRRKAAPSEKPVTGPRPSIRFLGAAAVRRAVDAPTEVAPGAGAEGGPAEADASEASAAVHPTQDASRIRDVRDPRNPRYKRPLR
jgi:hypothetical protein